MRVLLRRVPSDIHTVLSPVNTTRQSIAYSSFHSKPPSISPATLKLPCLSPRILRLNIQVVAAPLKSISVCFVFIDSFTIPNERHIMSNGIRPKRKTLHKSLDFSARSC